MSWYSSQKSGEKSTDDGEKASTLRKPKKAS